MKTLSISTEQAERNWVVVDATAMPVGRLATRVAAILRGKNKPTYTPHADTGDFVIITNAQQVKLTGAKEDQKLYRRHSGYPGGLHEERAKTLRQRIPTRLVETAVRGMLPKTKLGKQMYRKLKVYAGSEHPHAAQQPMQLEVS